MRKLTKSQTFLLAALFGLLFSVQIISGQTTADDYEKLSEKQFNESNFEAGIRSAGECIRLDPKRAACYARRAFMLSSKDVPAAVADYTEAIRLKPNIEAYYVQRGYIYLELLKNYDAAIADYTQALKLNLAASNYSLLGRAFAGKKDFKNALTNILQAIKLDPQPYNYYEQRGDYYMALGEYQKAADDISRALYSEVNMPALYEKRSKAFCALGQYDNALFDERKMQDYGKTPTEPCRAPATVAEAPTPAAESAADKELKVREAEYKQALEDAPKQKDPTDYRGKALAKFLTGLMTSGRSDAANGDIILAKFNELIEIDFYAVTISVLFTNYDIYKIKSILARMPYKGEAIIKSSRWFQDSQSNKNLPYPADLPPPGSGWSQFVARQSVASNNPAPSRTPAPGNNLSPEATIILAKSYLDDGISKYQQKDYDGAIKAFTECIKLSPQSRGCYFNRAASNIEKRNYQAAIEDLTQAIKLDPQFTDAYIRRAFVYVDLGNPQMASADFEAALKLDPSNQKIKDALNAAQSLVASKKEEEATIQQMLKNGRDLTKDNNLDGALSTYNVCLQVDPKRAECYAGRGFVYGLKNDDDAAIKDFTTAISLKPLPAAYYGRGLSYSLKTNYEAAIKDFNEALRLSPQNAKSFAERGRVYLLKGDYPAALADLNQAIKLDPQDEETYFLRGYTNQNLNNRDAAIADYKKALQIKPDYEKAKTQLKALGVEP